MYLNLIFIQSSTIIHSLVLIKIYNRVHFFLNGGIKIKDDKTFCTEIFISISLKIVTPIYVLCIKTVYDEISNSIHVSSLKQLSLKIIILVWIMLYLYSKAVLFLGLK